MEIGGATLESTLMRLLSKKSWKKTLVYTQLPYHKTSRARNPDRVGRLLIQLVALLLALVALACSSVSDGVTGAAAGVSCNWERKGERVMPAEPLGVCWHYESPEVAMTPASVTEPCAVDRERLSSAGPGETVATWVHAWTTQPGNADEVWPLESKPGDNCQ